VHQADAELAVLAAFTTKPQCARKANRAPTAAALALASAHNAADVAISSVADDGGRVAAPS
jgi:hypothetical protein